MAADVESKYIRSLLAKNSFGISTKNYLTAVSLLGEMGDDDDRLSRITEQLETDESAYKNVNIFRLSFIFRIRHIVLNQIPPEIFTRKSAFLGQKGGALFDDGIAGALSSSILPYQILLPFGLPYGTSREYFSEIDFNSNLSAADANLYRFFSKIGDNNFNRRTHAWIPQITRSTREIYDNILNHAVHASHAPKYQYTDLHKRERARFWFFGFRRFVYSDSSEYFSSLPSFKEYRDKFSKPAKYYIVVKISDDGPGIVRYYTVCSGKDDDKTSLAEIIQNRLSSTNISGAGHGISNAAAEIIRNKGFLQVEANSESYTNFYDAERDIAAERSAASSASFAGTSVDLILPVF